jgi:hypothetical protein
VSAWHQEGAQKGLSAVSLRGLKEKSTELVTLNAKDGRVERILIQNFPESVVNSMKSS